KRGSIHTHITSRHTIPMTAFWYRRVGSNTIKRRMNISQQNMTPYRAKVWSGHVSAVDWEINMTFHEWRVSRLVVDTWQSIFLRTVFSPQSGRKIGGVSVTPRTGQNLMTKRERLLFSLVRLIGLDWATRR